MSRTVVVYRSHLTDPFLNLAAEDYLLRSRPRRERALLLYTNDPAVVIGRHQNPWVECNPVYLAQNGIVLVRRQSGGGTVYHDHGNLNFSILSAREEYDQEWNFAVVIEALRLLGIHVERSGRNDLVCDGYKVSGSAFKHLRERSFHHGTLLVAADLARLRAALQPSPVEISSRGIASVRSRVANLVDLASQYRGRQLVSAVSDALAAAFSRRRRALRCDAIDAAFLAERPEIGRRAAEYRSWDWLYGKTPRFEQVVRGVNGRSVGLLRVEHGRIAAVEPNGGGANRPVSASGGDSNAVGSTEGDRGEVPAAVQLGAPYRPIGMPDGTAFDGDSRLARVRDNMELLDTASDHTSAVRERIESELENRPRRSANGD